jgi:hypothetical protein
MIVVFDKQADGVTATALADVAGDLRRYELLGDADDGKAGGGQP